MNDIEKIDAMIRQLRELKSDINRMSKLSTKECQKLTISQSKKISSDKNWIAMSVIKQRHELHALAVEIGISDKRENYKEIMLSDGWREFNYQPREPFPTCK